MMFIKSRIATNNCESIPKCDNVNDFMKVIEAQFGSSDKALPSTLMTKLSSMKLLAPRECTSILFKWETWLLSLVTKVWDIQVVLVHFFLNSLSSQYGPFKFFVTPKRKRSINELLTKCVRMKRDWSVRWLNLNIWWPPTRRRSYPLKRNAKEKFLLERNEESIYFFWSKKICMKNGCPKKQGLA